MRTRHRARCREGVRLMSMSVIVTRLIPWRSLRWGDLWCSRAGRIGPLLLRGPGLLVMSSRWGRRRRRGTGDGGRSGRGPATRGPARGSGDRGRAGQRLFWPTTALLGPSRRTALATGLRHRAGSGHFLLGAGHRHGGRRAERTFRLRTGRTGPGRNGRSRGEGLLFRALPSRGARRRRGVAKRLLARGAIRWRVRGHGRQTFLLTRNLYYLNRHARLQDRQCLPCQLSRRTSSARSAACSPALS